MQVKDEKANWLTGLSGELLRLQASMVRERDRVKNVLRDKDNIIAAQAAEIDALRRQNATLALRQTEMMSGGATAAVTSPVGAISQRVPTAVEDRSAATRLQRQEEDKCSPKPPVPSRAGVNKKLQISGGGGGQSPAVPPPPPPRGVSLRNNGSGDDNKNPAAHRHNAQNSNVGGISIIAAGGNGNGGNPDKYTCDKTESNIDSGRESDETFDNESVKSSDLSPSPPHSSSAASSFPAAFPAAAHAVSAFPPSYHSDPAAVKSNVSQASEFGHHKIVSTDKKTKVTFWTDTYL